MRGFQWYQPSSRLANIVASLGFARLSFSFLHRSAFRGRTLNMVQLAQVVKSFLESLIMPFEVAVDISQIVNAAVQLSTVGKRVRKTILAAMNRAGDQGFTVVKRTLAAQTGIKQSDLTGGASGIRKQIATSGSFEYDVVAKSSTTPLSYFHPTQTAPGVSASPWGQRRIFSGTFLATMKSGHVGVWAHESGPPQYVRRISPTSGRTYYSQSNIRQLWGPSIAKELVKEPTPEAFKKKVVEVFTPRLTHELERMIKSIDAKTKMAAGHIASSPST
jgi:hypothetical protein